MARTKKAKPAKKAKKQKKVVAKKRTTKRVVSPVENVMQALVTLTPEQLYQPDLETGKNLVPGRLKETQAVELYKPTPQGFIKQRKGKGGKIFGYVTGDYMERRADYIFNFMWSFVLSKQEIIGEFIVSTGYVELIDPKTLQPFLRRWQNGEHQIAFAKDKPHTPENYVGIGQDFKASATDCKKKCLSSFGIARDVYAPNEILEEMGGDTKQTPTTTTPEQLQQIITKAINNAKDTTTLLDIDEKLQATDKLPKNIKQALHTAISNRIDVLNVESGK